MKAMRKIRNKISENKASIGCIMSLFGLGLVTVYWVILDPNPQISPHNIYAKMMAIVVIVELITFFVLLLETLKEMR